MCQIINETDTHITNDEIETILDRIVPELKGYDYLEIAQDKHLSLNQLNGIKCGDNGIFKGVPITLEQHRLRTLVKLFYSMYPYDSKFILDQNKLICCQSNVETQKFYDFVKRNNPDLDVIVNPLGDWTGGINVDTGATNRKLGSDMGDSVTGGGLHGKDLSKADVSVNIYAFLKAQQTGKEVKLSCAIGDETVDGKPYSEIVETARKYIESIGGFEKFAEWGLIR